MRTNASRAHRPDDRVAVGTAAQAAAARLLTLGGVGAHPAGAVVGTLVDGVESVAAAGIAQAGDGAASDAGGGGAASAEDHGGLAASDSRPMAVDTLLDLASVTKVASTTALAMLLVADGSLDLDERVATHLPAFARSRRSAWTDRSVRAARESVTLRQLLGHTSGLPPWLPLYCHTTYRDEAVELAATTPLTTAPGTGWAYSDLGMIVLGAVLEQVTGQGQDVAFAQRVAAPLGLRHAAYGPVAVEQAAASADSDVIEHQMVTTGDPYPTDARVDDFAGWRTGATVGEVNDGNAAHALGGVAGHAGLFATLPELLVIGRSLVDPDVVTEAVIREFTAPQQAAPGRGLGFSLMTADVAGERVPMAVHAGFTGAWLGISLDRDLVVAAAATRLHTTTGTIDHPRTGRDGLVGTSEIAAVVLDHVGAALQHGTGAP